MLSNEKSPYIKTKTNEKKTIKQSHNTRTPPNIDYPTIADRLKTVSWSKYSHSTGV